MKINRDSFLYAMETTKVIHEPDRRIATFGETRFQYQLITELMDNNGEVRVRSGDMEAAKPLIIRPDPSTDMEGFGDEARERLEKLIDMLRERGEDLAFMQYGFRFRRSHVEETIYQDSLENVQDRLLSEVKKNGNPMLAIITGVDDAWEVSLMKFAFDMILQSQQINAFDFRRKNML